MSDIVFKKSFLFVDSGILSICNHDRLGLIVRFDRISFAVALKASVPLSTLSFAMFVWRLSLSKCSNCLSTAIDVTCLNY